MSDLRSPQIARRGSSSRRIAPTACRDELLAELETIFLAECYKRSVVITARRVR